MQNSSLVTLQRIAREQDRQRREGEQALRRQVREQARAEREQLRIHAQLDRQQRQRYLESRIAEAEELTAEVQATMESLGSILEASLKARAFSQ